MSNNQPSVQDRINMLKQSYQDALLKKAKCETQLETARTNLALVAQQCNEHGIAPEELQAKLTELQGQITEALSEAESLLPQTAN